MTADSQSLTVKPDRRSLGFARATALAAAIAVSSSRRLLQLTSGMGRTRRSGTRKKHRRSALREPERSKKTHTFAAGIQDDVLTSLAQIHDLKVISRTSVMSYQKPSRGNVREIGRALGVANLLEGSVRRMGNRSSSMCN